MVNRLLRSIGSSRDRLRSNISFEHFEAVISELSKLLTKQQDHVQFTHTGIRAQAVERALAALKSRTGTHTSPPCRARAGAAGPRKELEVCTPKSYIALRIGSNATPKDSQSCFPPLGPTSCTTALGVLSA